MIISLSFVVNFLKSVFNPYLSLFFRFKLLTVVTFPIYPVIVSSSSVQFNGVEDENDEDEYDDNGVAWVFIFFA